MKQLRIIDLEIIDDLLESGASNIALVDKPAILKDFLAFRDENPDLFLYSEEVLETVIALALEIGTEDHEETCFALTPVGSVKSKVKGAIVPVTKRGELQEGEDNAILLYKYEGPPAQRNFCRGLLGLNRLYSLEDITTLSQLAINPGYGLGGTNTYDIFEFRGGVNCKHHWVAYNCWLEEGKFKKAKAFDGPTEEVTRQKFSIENEDEHILVGVAMIPNMNIYRIDENTQEEFYVRFSKESVAKIAEKFMREHSMWSTNQDHNPEDPAGTYVFESWIVEDLNDKANTIYKFDVPVGSWIVKMRVKDEEVWKRVKSGELKGFSIEGNFVPHETA